MLTPTETCRVVGMLINAFDSLGIEYATFRVCPHGQRRVLLSLQADDGAAAVSKALGADLIERRFDGHRWIEATAELDGAHIVISGPHHALPKLEAVP